MDTIDQCSSWGSAQDQMGLRVAAVFILLVASLLGVFLPMLLARVHGHRRLIRPALFVCKYVGSGVILSTAFMHLLSPAVQALSDACLASYLPKYDWGIVVCMVTIMVMFALELLAARFDLGFGHGHGHTHEPLPSDSRAASPASQSKYMDTSLLAHGSGTALLVPADVDVAERQPALDNSLTYSSDHDAHTVSSSADAASYAGQIVTLIILEFGIVFHSLFIGMSLASSAELHVLLTVISFHQFFEGLGLGSRLAVTDWLSSWKRLTGVFMAVGYAVTTPIGVAVGVAVHRGLASSPARAQLANGIFDAISAGILIYTALVELLAHEFLFSPEMCQARPGVELLAYGCVAAGVAVMAVLAKWV